MNPIDRVLAESRAERRTAFLPFLPAGDPDTAFTTEALHSLARIGASMVEVGFPFSDPIADGPVIQESYTRALSTGLKVDTVFDCIRQATATPGWSMPCLAMASYSPDLAERPEAFLASAASSGISGIVAPDLPVEEANEFAKLCADRNIKLILLVTPTTDPHRAERIVRTCTGFVYVVGVVGITGPHFPIRRVPAHLARLRTMTDLPLCVGFGVSTPEHVRALKGLADGVIVGSALVKTLEESDRAKAMANFTSLAAQIAQACG